jgi:serpin B
MKTILTIFIFGMLLLSGCTSRPSDPAEPMVGCEVLKNSVYTMIEEANYCSQDSDCKVVSYGCPFGCGSYVNLGANVEEIKRKAGSYNECVGNPCIYDCEAPRDPECVNGKCVLKIEPLSATTTTIPASKAVGVVEGNNLLALDLYAKYKTEKGNIFFSPFSISSALAMTYEGARGRTAEEMKDVLHLPEDINVLREEYYALYQGINAKDKKYELSTANALWAQKDYRFLQEYFSLVEKNYAGKVTNLDFATDTENSRQTINKWVEDQTKEKIKNLIPAGYILPSTVLVLTNAVYFKGEWVRKFDAKKTIDMDYMTGTGTTVKSRAMVSTGKESRFNYMEDDAMQVLEMPYSGDDLSMLVLLPKGDDLEKMEQLLSAETLAKIRNGLKNEQVNTYFPKFQFETKYYMEKDLQEMGMKDAFSGNADFSGMTGVKDLFISHVIHQAYVEVNEEGTQAAAATAVIMDKLAAPQEQIHTFKADHPFVFIIQQKSSGNILFMGRVSDPTVQ